MYVLRANTAAMPLASLTARLLAAHAQGTLTVAQTTARAATVAVRRVVRCWPMGPVHDRAGRARLVIPAVNFAAGRSPIPVACVVQVMVMATPVFPTPTVQQGPTAMLDSFVLTHAAKRPPFV